MARLRFGLGYAYLPLISAIVWFGTVLALLIIWLATGHPKYQTKEHTIVYISDVGAKYQALFVAGASVTAVFFVATLIADRALRHRNRLPAFTRNREERFSAVAIFFGVLGMLALILLTSLNAFDFSTVHWIMTVIFVISIALNALFNTLETHYMSRQYPILRRMRHSRNAKLALVTLGILGAIGMAISAGICRGSDSNSRCDGSKSASAVFEWFVAFVFAGYISTFIADLLLQDKPTPQLEQEMREAGFEPNLQNKIGHATIPATPVGTANA